MSAVSPVSCFEKSPGYYPSVPSVSTVTWPGTVPSTYVMLPWSSWERDNSVRSVDPCRPAAVAPLDYTSFWPTVPSLGRYSVFLPPGSSLARSYEKPNQSYIGLISEAILSSPDKKLVLSGIYNYILTHYPYFRTKGSGWRNSIRHNLSLNDCFIKAGRSPNAKGHFWIICPTYYGDFLQRYSDRRRRAGKVITLDLRPAQRVLSHSPHRYFAFFSEEAKSSVPAQRETTPPRYDERDHDKVKLTDVDCVTIDRSSPEQDPGRRRSFDVQSLFSL